jgi:hypothetical protein
VQVGRRVKQEVHGQVEAVLGFERGVSVFINVLATVIASSLHRQARFGAYQMD